MPGCKLHLLEQHHACLRWTTLKTIIAQPQWQGVQCLFIVDACRLPLEANKSAGVAEFEDGVLLRDPIFVKKSQTTNHAPLSLFHSCAEGASAAEIPALKAGIFTQALLDLIKAGAEPPSLFDERFAGQVAVRMQAITNVHGVAGLQFAVESPYQLHLQLAEPAYLLLLAQGSSGAIYQLAPHTTPTRLPVGEYRLPGALFADPDQMLAFGNIGNEACYAYLSATPLPRVQALPTLTRLDAQSASHLLRALAAPGVSRVAAQAQVRASQ